MIANDKKDQAKDTGMALVLILLVAGRLWPADYLFPATVAALLLNMTCPGLYYQPARLWFGLSHYLGGFASRVLLTAVFFLVVTPMGLIRRFCGADPMQRRRWKDGAGSLFTDRSHLYDKNDIEKPF